MGRARECKHGHEFGCVKCGPDPKYYTEEYARGASSAPTPERVVVREPKTPFADMGNRVLFKSDEFEMALEVSHLPRCGDFVEIPNKPGKWWVRTVDWMPLPGGVKLVPVIRLITASVE